MKYLSLLALVLINELSVKSETVEKNDLFSRRSIRGRRFRRFREGAIRLVGGRSQNEGNVEIYHLGKWGSICDDEWDIIEANIVCKSLKYELGAVKATENSEFGRGRKLIWMDSVYCSGNESTLNQCPFDGWSVHDCDANEAAGVVCNQTRLNSNEVNINLNDASQQHAVSAKLNSSQFRFLNIKLSMVSNEKIRVRIAGGRHRFEGRVELFVNNEWGLVCGNGWALFEATVICRSLGFGFAEHAVQTAFFGGQNMSFIFNGVKCEGHEKSMEECTAQEFGANVRCPGNGNSVAGVICTQELPDLILDEKELESSIYLEDRPLLLLQCAVEEKCLSNSVSSINMNYINLFYERRRLLRFTTRIGNVGTSDFKPILPKNLWLWHSCHRHFHSMEVFAHFELINSSGNRTAEGHKASFCLEDNFCQQGFTAKYFCANYGDQGISVGCVDTYLHNVDCQWIDITDISSGIYQLKISINPEYKVAELNYDNNAAICSLYYNKISVRVWNCTLTRP